jgi:methionyl-tRNA formyltransferase
LINFDLNIKRGKMPLDKTIIHQITTNSITTLDLSNTGIGDAGAKDLAEALKINKSITSIDLCYNKIGDTEAKALAEALKDNKSIYYSLSS